MSAPELDIYTDGSCKGNPGPGGWAFVEIGGDGEVRNESGGEPDTTNNRMELLAVIKALEAYPASQALHLLTDSTYVANGMQKWMDGWKRNGWRRRDRRLVANHDLWLSLDGLRQGRQLRLSWVRGHDTTPGNLRADELAQAAAGRASGA